ncbi:MATE efflux family protein 4, chloroplastic [Symbiodinium microadriaticum]|uniref:MATE efflux family protein 4, chloroplastic n=1 Tax=Symbiodinium microadriaticum TaxID=2951 RepID=A0A1Q9ECL9_SYMMI|nr:MATE efflux family protein 4, chloroplastic [Symbiodinium microadriaticum]
MALALTGEKHYEETVKDNDCDWAASRYGDSVHCKLVTSLQIVRPEISGDGRNFKGQALPESELGGKQVDKMEGVDQGKLKKWLKRMMMLVLVVMIVLMTVGGGRDDAAENDNNVGDAVHEVARALGKGRSYAAQELSRALSASAAIGVLLTGLYLVGTPVMLKGLGVAPELRPDATTYVRIRGLVAWAALCQSVALSGLLAAKDSLTPLKVVSLAALLNFLGDFLLCAWPFRLGLAGAAAATAASTLAGFLLMLRALKRSGMAPKLGIPKPDELTPLLEYARPLAVVISFRCMSLTVMAKTAGTMGTASIAGYQVLANVVVLFGLFGEPLSQTAQTMLPSLLDGGPDRQAQARTLLRNLAGLAIAVSAAVGGAAFLALQGAGGVFSRDPQVQEILRSTIMVPITISSLILSQACDGTMLAAKEFPLVIKTTLLTTSLQVLILCGVNFFHWGLEVVFLSLAVRYWIFLAVMLTKALSGSGPLGRALRGRGGRSADEKR